MLLDERDKIVRFSPEQKLPPGYTVQWWNCDEHYHWVLDADTYSVEDSSRWSCWRGAWAHYRGESE